jgi:hypothetical protein
MLEIADNANLHPRAGDVGEAESARETLIAVGVVVLEVELEVNGLLEVALLLVLGEGDDFLDGGGKFVGGDFRHLRGLGLGGGSRTKCVLARFLGLLSLGSFFNNKVQRL